MTDLPQQQIQDLVDGKSGSLTTSQLEQLRNALQADAPLVVEQLDLNAVPPVEE